MREHAPPSELAKRGQAIEIKGKIEYFAGLAKIIATELRELPVDQQPAEWRQSPVDIRLQFGWTKEQPGVPALWGRVAANLPAVCQRCLKPFEWAIDTELKLLLPDKAMTALELDNFEVWEFDGDNVRPVDIVEEALIMAMPLSALHESPDECAPVIAQQPDDDKETVRPFADLRSLMGDTED